MAERQTRESDTPAQVGDSVPTPRVGPASVKNPASSRKRPKRSKARPGPASTPPVPADVDSVQRPPAQGTLWTPDAKPRRRRSVDKADIAAAHRARLNNQPPRSSRSGHPSEDTTSVLIKHPDTRPISQEQLVAEASGIYDIFILGAKDLVPGHSQEHHYTPAGRYRELQRLVLPASRPLDAPRTSRVRGLIAFFTQRHAILPRNL